ncbi:hypothetical protein ABPG73_000588 [Tetrahymena malaccensis]
MSQRFCSFSIPEDYETIQNKSIQGKIFNNSAFYNLQGDNELVDRSSLNSLSICKDRNQISILDHTHSQQLGQMSENRQIEDIFLDQNSSKSKASERPLSNKQVLQVELFESISNQIQEVPNKEGNKNQNISLKNNLQDKKSSTYSVQNQINSNFMQESPNLSQKQNVNQSYDLNFIQTPIKNQEFGRINDSSSSRNARQNLIPVFMPTNTLRIYWDIFQIIFTYTFMYIYSIQIFFCSSQVDSEFIKCFFLYAFILFILDGLVNLNTAYFSQDAIVLNRRQIISRYLKSYIFLTDMISLFVMGAKVVIPTQSLIYNPQNNLILFSINFLIFLKLNGIQKKRNSFSQVFTLKENQKHMLRLFNQLLTVISVAHIVSLAWYYLGVYEIQSGYSITWLEKFNMLELSYIEKYIYSMYWSITTMTTEIEKSSKQLNDNITTIQRYLNRKNVNLSLKSRVRHYLSFLVEEQRDRNQQAENEILRLLSNKLRDEITVEVNSRIIKNCSFFTANFSTLTLKKLPFIMKEVLISPNEIIFEQEEYEDQSIYFIENGLVEIYQVSPPEFSGGIQYNNDQIRIIKQLKSNDLFGELSFFSGLARKACARSVNLSTMYKIDRKDFISLIKQNQEDFERFKMIEEEIKLQKDLFILHIECYACNQVGHTASKCPKIHRVFDSQFQILKDNFSVFQNRNKANRRLARQPNSNARLRIKQNIEISKILQENLRNLNSYTQLLFETNIEILSECSVKIYKESEQEYSSDSYQSSLNGEQISQTSITDKFKNDQHLSSQGDLKKQYKKGKTQKSVKKTKTTVKQDESFKNIITSLKDVQSNEYSHNQEKNNILNNSKQRNKVTLTQVDNSEKIIQSMEQQIEIGKEENKNLTAESIITQKLSYLNEKNTSSDLEENININQSQKVIKHRQSINNQDTNMNQRARKKQKNLSFQINQKQISNNSDIIQNLNFIEDLKSNQNNIKQQQQQQQQYNCKKNSFLQVNDLSLRPSIDFQLSNLSLKQFFEGYEMNQNYEDNFQKFEEFIKSQLTSPISSDPNIMNKIFFEYLLQNIKKKNSFTVEQKLSPSQKNSYQLLQSMESQINQALEQNKKQLFGQATQNDQQQHSNLSENFDKIKKCQTKLGYTSCLSSIKPQFQQQFERADIQSENYYLICKTIFEKFDVIKNFKKFYPHNNFENVISKYKLIKSNSKKNKNSKIQSKERRQNVLMQPIISRKSQFFNNLALANLPSLANQDSYKPTYLSYGISQRNDSIYPKQFQHQNQNNLIQK